MRLLLLGDMHLRVRPPRKRTEKDFMAVCLGKLGQVLEIAEKEECTAILQAGDFFHSPDPSKELMAEVIELLNNCWPDGNFYCVHGQHDQGFHSLASMKRSALRVLEAAGVVSLIDNWENTFCMDSGLGTQKVSVMGVAFGQDPPVTFQVADEFKVLVSHVMVGNEKLWQAQKLTSPGEYAKKHSGYDLYFCGDFHYQFHEKVGDADVINAGCLLRLTSSERDLAHRPGVVVYDTETRTYERIELDVAPVEEAFDLTEDKQKGRAELDAFVEKLRESGDVGISFAENLQRYYEANITPKEIRELVAAAGV